MSDTNKFSVIITKLTGGSSRPARLATKAHTITLSPDGTLTIRGERQQRVLRPDMWDTYTVTWREPVPPLSAGTDA